ncbi:type ISP restriction/modification enzyme [Candidatus Poriferisodalis sp.]|uniref:type ISP restriction/modification enzyme n=1 Tax=Candidatus Poriferisodalis sp. TaxID=3101277 RepID=UPI003B016C21
MGDHALGIATNCDTYVYSFSREELAQRLRLLIDAYSDALELVEAGCSVDECTTNDDLARIKWTGTLKQTLRRREPIVFEEDRIREVLYRPFTKLWLYEDPRILSSVKSISAMFRDEHRERERERERERGISVSSPSSRTRFSTLAVRQRIDLNCLDGGARFAPRTRPC